MKTKNKLAVIVAVLLAASLVQAAPHLTIKDAKFDFGYVPQNSTVTHRFWLYSTGDDTLKIEKVITG